MTEPITSFTGEHRWLSNFWIIDVVFEDVLYPSVEHAYVAAKTLDRATRYSIAKLSSPGAAKRAGRSLELRPDWDKVKLTVMKGLIRQKFMHVQLRRLLLSTGGAMLIEGNTWGDTFWGAVYRDGAIPGWSGDNNLGKILMKVRDEWMQGDIACRA